MRYVWIVEMRSVRGWEPTVGCGINLEGARREIKEWRENNPYERFRLRVYRAAQS